MSYLPNLFEFVVLALACGLTMGVGALLHGLWSLRSHTVPAWYSAVVLGIGIVIYSTILAGMWRYADDLWDPVELEIERVRNSAMGLGERDPGDSFLNEPGAPVPVDAESATWLTQVYLALFGLPTFTYARHFYVLIYGLIFAIPIAVYLGRKLGQSLSTNAVEHGFSMDTMPDMRGPFSKAARLAYAGNVDGAVAAYKHAGQDQAEAHLAAGRLLVKDGRFDEAAEMYRGVMDNYDGYPRVWAEACFELARLHDKAFGDRSEALRLLHRLIERHPEGEHGHRALRLQRELLNEGASLPIRLDLPREAAGGKQGGGQAGEPLVVNPEDDPLLRRLDAAFELPNNGSAPDESASDGPAPDPNAPGKSAQVNE